MSSNIDLDLEMGENDLDFDPDDVEVIEFHVRGESEGEDTLENARSVLQIQSFRGFVSVLVSPKFLELSKITSKVFFSLAQIL